MVCDTVPEDDAREELIAPADTEPSERPAPAGRTTLAALLGVSDDDLAEPIARVAPDEHRWEQLTLGDVSNPERDPSATAIRRVAASQPPTAEPELIPGSDAPGAIEVPVYLAGRAIREMMGDAQRETIRPPAIAMPGIGRRQKLLPAPAANFVRAEHATVLLPTARDPLRSLITNKIQVVRTIATLVFVPGELTRVFLAGHHRRFLGPAVVCVAALVLFTAVSSLGGLRPRPDRDLQIGTERVAGAPAGLIDGPTVDLAQQPAPDLVRDVAAALADAPLFWFPLMAFGVVAVAAAVRGFTPHDDFAEVVLTAHFTGWFVLWWGAMVPGLLFLLKLGLETGATWEGASRIRSLGDGRVEGLSTGWNAVRAITSSAHFHSGVLAMGLVPWASVAWHRVFKARWTTALLAGALLSMVPILLLLPFA